MGIADTAGDFDAVRHRRVDVSDLRTERVAAYARRQPGREVYLERRGSRTFLVAETR